MEKVKEEGKKKDRKKETSRAEKKSRLSAMKRLVIPRKKIEKEEKTKKLEKERVGKLEKEKRVPALVEEDPFTILKFVLMTEKAIQLIEKDNKLIFIVDRECSKNDIKRAAESAFQAAVKDIKTLIDQEGRKKAFIRFREAGIAGDIAMRLGII